MIHARVTRNPDSQLDGIHLSITAESISTFAQLVNRALNCWDSAPKEIKELGDMLTHGYITQDHTYKPINSNPGRGGDYHTIEEQEIIQTFIESAGLDAWLEHLRNNTQHKVLKPGSGT